MHLAALTSFRFATAQWFRVWRLSRCLSRPEIELTGDRKHRRLLVFAGVAFGLLLVCQINAPTLLPRSAPIHAQEQAALAACVMMGPKQVRVANARNQGFTLLELSVVLVIIGLIVGGVLVGQDLIKGAQLRAQIGQIEKYQSAVHAFQNEYGALPGDITDPNASAFGFTSRGPLGGEGDGNGVIQGVWNSNPTVCGSCQSGEPTMFWEDLSAAGLIEGKFNNAVYNGVGGPVHITTATTPNLSQIYPSAKIGNGNYVVVWSSGVTNFFSVTAIPDLYTWGNARFIDWINAVNPNMQNAITVQQAYAIDKKIDDGLPQAGQVIANVPIYAVSQWAGTTNLGSVPYTTATPGSSATCFDNNNVASGTQQYSTAQNSGAGVNCALSFAFQ